MPKSRLAEELQRIGLTDKEASAYLVLLSFGTRSTTFIARKSGLNRGTAYIALHSLLEKGLVTKAVRQKVQCFSPLEPKQLLSYITRTEEQLKTQRQRIAGLLPELAALGRASVTKPRFEFFEGAEGARNALEATLGAKDKTLRAFLSLADIIDYVGEDFFDNYAARRIRAGYKLNVIRAAEKDKEAFLKHVPARKYKTSSRDKRSVRHLDSGAPFPISTYIFDDILAVISSSDEDFSLLIQSRELSAMQRTLFDLIWSGLKK